jgi:hypothetical protein
LGARVGGEGRRLRLPRPIPLAKLILTIPLPKVTPALPLAKLTRLGAQREEVGWPVVHADDVAAAGRGVKGVGSRAWGQGRGVKGVGLGSSTPMM